MCTGIRLRAEDGSVVYARTLEFAAELHSDIIAIPRGYEFVGTTAFGKPGLPWQSKYAVAGANADGQTMLSDGVNEKGLAAGSFYLPGYASYQAVTKDEADVTIAPHEFVTWALTGFATVSEVHEGLSDIRVGNVEYESWGMIFPLHFIIHDERECIVVEYVDGKPHVHDNPIGVITNAPTFDWHLTNLGCYVNISPVNVPPVDMDGFEVRPSGQGSGMLGLPGDFTPPSRFVRAATFVRASLPTATADETVMRAFHILNQFDIPLGTVRETSSGKDDELTYERTQWTSASDLSNRSFYIRTAEDSRIRRLSLMDLDLEAGKVKTVKLDSCEAFVDVTGSAV